MIFVPATDFNEQEYQVICQALKQHGYRIFITSDAVTCCTGSNGMKVRNDVLLANARAANFHALILIGGYGSAAYYNNTVLHRLVKQFGQTNKVLGAICLAPNILLKAGILRGRRYTAFGQVTTITAGETGNYIDSPIVADGTIITGRDSNAANEFITFCLQKMSN
ncbi:MAG: DJ-1/PfpI family protein [Ignavibacteria bacterium]|nr:DJ-1/PfpI family protein [Ignavibacteria bacterium]